MRLPRLAFLTAFLLSAPVVGLVSSAGCGSTSDDSTPFNPGVDGSMSSSSSGASGSGTSSSSTSGSSSGSGSGSSSGGGTSSGGSSTGGSSGGNDGSSPVVDGSSGGHDGGAPGPSMPQCGSGPCDLSTHTCCLTQFASGTCVAHGTACPANTAAFSCGQAADCPSGQVCCGIASSTTMQAQTSCQTVAPGGTCPGANTSTSGSAQLCMVASECVNGMACIPQACKINPVITANLTMCGLQSQAPFNCAKK